MKAFGIVVFSLFVLNAHASLMTTKCSNADGSVRWETGTEEDLIHLKYANFVEGILTLEIEKVKIDLKNEVTLDQKSYSACHFKGDARVFAAQARITGSEKHPHVLQSHFPANEVQTHVICTTSTSQDIECMDED